MECGLISKHFHHQLARCNPLFHIFSVLVPTGFVLVGLIKQKQNKKQKQKNNNYHKSSNRSPGFYWYN